MRLHALLAGAPQWKYVPVRRFLLFLERSLYRATGWAVFEPNGAQERPEPPR